MRNKLFIQILIPSLLSYLMVIFSTSKDLITYFALLGGLIILLIISINVHYFPRMGLMKYRLKEKIPTISIFASLLAIVGLVLGSFQPIGWMNFFPFGYYVILSSLLIITLERVSKLRFEEF